MLLVALTASVTALHQDAVRLHTQLTDRVYHQLFWPGGRREPRLTAWSPGCHCLGWMPAPVPPAWHWLSTCRRSTALFTFHNASRSWLGHQARLWVNH